MNKRLRYLLPLLVLPTLPLYFMLVNRRAFRQNASEVVIRGPGKRLLGPPKPVGPEAKMDLPFAWQSQAVYKKRRNVEDGVVSGCTDAEAGLRTLGWTVWDGFPDATLQSKIAKSNLRVEVWENPELSLVAVAFGGTVATSGKDWKSNLRWFIPFHHDEYTELVEQFGPAFVAEYKKRKATQASAFLEHAILVSTGHSLGGGLAQQFAYSLPLDAEVPRVKKVYAFDPSPVTGYSSVKKSVRDTNRRDLQIDRIYERGEILALLRSFTNFVDPPNAEDPSIRQIRYSLFRRWNPIKGHSIPELACKLDKAVH